MFLGKGQVLVIDDSSPVVNVVKTVLEGAGYGVSVFTSAKEALMHITDVRPDLIISDILMPEMDGFEFREALIDDRRTSHIPFAFLTARDDIELMIKGLSSGVIDYFTKPIKPKELLEHVAGVLDNLRSARQRLLDRITVERNVEDVGFENVERVFSAIMFTGRLILAWQDKKNELTVFYNRGVPIAAKSILGKTGHDAYVLAEKIKGEFVVKSESVDEVRKEF
ncbi:MAG: response regulator [Caldisericia bacterium]